MQGLYTRPRFASWPGTTGIDFNGVFNANGALVLPSCEHDEVVSQRSSDSDAAISLNDSPELVSHVSGFPAMAALACIEALHGACATGFWT